MLDVKNIEQQIKAIKKSWTPIEIATFNGQAMRLVLFEGEYHFHKHQREDELFFVYKGAIEIETKDHGLLKVNEGEFTIIPKGTEHKPISKEKSFVLLIEPKTIKSKGD